MEIICPLQSFGCSHAKARKTLSSVSIVTHPKPCVLCPRLSQKNIIRLRSFFNAHCDIVLTVNDQFIRATTSYLIPKLRGYGESKS